ncbi:hypothetical protein [Streptomyces sp. NPDC006012]|uniref:hypothetical protein n=1 Tax=Streptomyces sp. NPDC006012 TaxID=3364739 RepID=UPI0036A72C61
MSYGDAARVLKARAHLSDLDAALKLLGYRLDHRALLSTTEREAELWIGTGPEAPGDTDDAEPSEALLLPLDEEWDEPFDDDRDGEEIGWDWGHEEERSGDGRVRLGRNGGLVPYVLPSEEIQVQPPDQDEAGSIERPRSPEANAQQVRARITRYADAWDGRRVRELLVRKVPGDRVDVVRLARSLAEGETIREIPLLRRTKIALPIQIVHDIGLFTGPLGYDLQAFLDVMVVSGSPGLDRIAFRHSLADGCGTGPVWEWQDYRIPRRTSAVVLVSGLYGADPHGRVGEFEHLMATLHRHGHHARAVWFGDLPEATVLRRPEQWVVHKG